VKNKLTVNEFIDEFEKDSHKIAIALWPTCSNSKSNECLDLANKWINSSLSAKFDAQQKQVEQAANLFLSIQCLASAMASQILMWENLRNFNPNKAWDLLIDAQEYIEVAIQAHETPHLYKQQKRLQSIQDIVFADVKFVSSAFTYRSGDCTICGQRYSKCEHESGLVYMGRLCRELNLRDIEFNHIAIVDSPRDKRCRITAIEREKGKYEDCFTGELVDCEEPQEVDGMLIKANVFCNGVLPNV
jgi:hypothetical protein